MVDEQVTISGRDCRQLSQRAKIKQSGAAARLNLSNVTAEDSAEHINKLLMEGRVFTQDQQPVTYEEVVNMLTNDSVQQLCEVSAALVVSVQSFSDRFKFCSDKVEEASNHVEKANEQLVSATQKLEVAESSFVEFVSSVNLFAGQMKELACDGNLQVGIDHLKQTYGVMDSPREAVGAEASSDSFATGEEAGITSGSSAIGANKEQVGSGEAVSRLKGGVPNGEQNESQMQVVGDATDRSNKVNIVPIGDAGASKGTNDTATAEVVAAAAVQVELVHDTGTSSFPDGEDVCGKNEGEKRGSDASNPTCVESENAEPSSADDADGAESDSF